MDAILFFPRDVLLEIFSRIQCRKKDRLNCLLVCRYWHDIGKISFDPSENSQWAIRWSVSNYRIDCVKSLLKDARVDPSAQSNYAIRWASQHEYTEIVKLLLADSRVDPSAGNNLALRWASENGHVEIVKLLLKDPRVDPSARDNEAMRWASQNGHLEIVKVVERCSTRSHFFLFPIKKTVPLGNFPEKEKA
jgi:hypothetical protein